MKKLISIILALVMCLTLMVSVSAEDSVIVDFGDVAGQAGDVDVDTYITATDLACLKKVLLEVSEAQSFKTANERYAFTQENWPNNIFYHSEIVKDKIMLVSIYNSAGPDTQKYYTEAFTAKDALGNVKTDTVDNFFAADLAIAKANGYKVLLFQHVPTSTGKEEDANLKRVAGSDKENNDFYHLSGNADNDTQMDKNMYKLITENADLIKGIFNGHVHNVHYSTVKAKSTPESATYDAVIPQYTASLNAYGNGNVTKIIVKY